MSRSRPFAPAVFVPTVDEPYLFTDEQLRQLEAHNYTWQYATGGCKVCSGDVSMVVAGCPDCGEKKLCKRHKNMELKCNDCMAVHASK